MGKILACKLGELIYSNGPGIGIIVDVWNVVGDDMPIYTVKWTNEYNQRGIRYSCELTEEEIREMQIFLFRNYHDAISS